METELQCEDGQRYRLAWEKWLKDEESATLVRDMGKRPARGRAGLTVYPENGPKTATVWAEGKKASARAPIAEDIGDLSRCIANLPTDPEGVGKECGRWLREDLDRHRKRGRSVHGFRALPGGRRDWRAHDDYRRLIVGRVWRLRPSEVDGALGMLSGGVSGFVLFLRGWCSIAWFLVTRVGESSSSVAWSSAGYRHVLCRLDSVRSVWLLTDRRTLMVRVLVSS